MGTDAPPAKEARLPRGSAARALRLARCLFVSPPRLPPPRQTPAGGKLGSPRSDGGAWTPPAWRERRGKSGRLVKGTGCDKSAFRRRPAAPARIYQQSARAPRPLPSAPGRRRLPRLCLAEPLAGSPGWPSGDRGWEDGEWGGGGGWWCGSPLPPRAFLFPAPLFQGSGFPPLYNKLRNLQRLLDPRTGGSQLCEIMSLVRTTSPRGR